MKAGLEIHQQLDTHKLFCNCPSVLRTGEPDYEVKRRLHAVAGESGEIDVAAKFEAEREKEFIYQGYDTTCLVELDEEPPHEINKEALQIALHVALYLNCEIIPVTQIMRKTVVDGSNTSGFQRTVLIARNGYVETESGKVRIENISLEEDAARVVEGSSKKKSLKASQEGEKVFRLDRLGIPLIEIGTAPDIKSPEQTREVALHIGDILRSCKVKRGIGTIRQDVNVSTSLHPRVEIKGFQEPKMFVDVIKNEIKRQEGIIEINKSLKKVRVNKEKDLTELFEKTNCKFIKKLIEKGGRVYGFKLKGFKEVLGKEFYKGRRFGSELSDYAKKAGVKGIIHSDEKLSKYGFEKEIDKVNEELKMGKEDAFVLIAGNEKKVKRAIARVKGRVESKVWDLLEVRKANEDGSTEFLRPMPGAARMYPETDLPLLRIKKQLIDEAKRTLPKKRSEIKEDLRKRGLNEQQIKELLKAGRLKEFGSFLEIINNPKLVFQVLIEIPKEVAKHSSVKNIRDFISLDAIEKIFEELRDGRLEKEDVKFVMQELIKGKSIEEAVKVEKADKEEVENEISKIVKEKPGLSMGGYMGLVMKKFKGKVSGKEASVILQRLLK